MSDQTAPTVQPGEDPSQGVEEATGTGLYDLASAPEEYRPFIEAELKKIEKNVTGKFTEAADHRKKWEPYEALGVADVAPEDLQGLLRLYELAQDETKFDEWLKSTAEQRGLLGDDAGLDDDEDDEDGDGDDRDDGHDGGRPAYRPVGNGSAESGESGRRADWPAPHPVA